MLGNRSFWQIRSSRSSFCRSAREEEKTMHNLIITFKIKKTLGKTAR